MSLLSLFYTTAVVLASTVAFGYLFVPRLFRVVLRALGEHLRRRSAATKRELVLKGEGGVVVGFFHPFCNAGGGGERVLWAAIRATQKKHPDVMCVVYTGDQDADKATILARVEDRFDIHLDPARVLFLFLSTRHWVAASTWPRFTLIGQSLGSLILAWDAFRLLVPDVFIDTMGYAFTLPFAKLLFGIPTGAYVHYPTISTDMLSSLPSSSFSSSSFSLRTHGKLLYWRLFALLYRRCGSGIDTIMCNSSWTASHLRQLWPSRATSITVVFPPVAVEALHAAIPPGTTREKVVLCIAQFRPEKKHAVIIEAFAAYCTAHPEDTDTRLVLIGSVRHSEDATRVYELRLLAHGMGVKDRVVFVCDASWPEILRWLARAWIGVNAMWNEHFGIGVVEYQAAGLVSVVHNSGGPKMDIVVDVDGGATGCHAETTEEFAKGFEWGLNLPPKEVEEMRCRARTSAGRFTEAVFAEAWLVGLGALLEMHRKKR